MKKRIDFVDLAKGFCIILVILGHTDLNNDFAKICSSFRMPLYYALSGMFFKTYSNFIEFTIKKINNLIIPFLFFNLLLWLFFINYYDVPIFPLNLFRFYDTEVIYNNPPIWFLLSLFEINILFYTLYLITKGKDVFIFISSILIGITGVYLSKNNINIHLFFDTSLTAFPFFIFGYWLKNNTLILSPTKYDKYIPFAIVSLLAIMYFLARPIDLRVNIVNNNIFSFYLVGISGFLLVLLLAKMIKSLPVVTYMGRYSLIMFGIHWLYLIIINREIKPSLSKIYPDFVYFLILLTCAYLTIPIFKKIFPWFTAQKELIPSKWGVKKKKEDVSSNSLL